MAEKKRQLDKVQLCTKIKIDNMNWLRSRPEGIGNTIDKLFEEKNQPDDSKSQASLND